jgi:hypothetical protein
MAGGSQLVMSISPHYDGQFLRGCPVSSYLTQGGYQVDHSYFISIYSLTRSRLQSGLVLTFSVIAFIVGIVCIATTWNSRAYGSCVPKYPIPY